MFENIHGKMLNLPSTLRTIMSKVTAAALQVPSPGPSARHGVEELGGDRQFPGPPSVTPALLGVDAPF